MPAVAGRWRRLSGNWPLGVPRWLLRQRRGDAIAPVGLAYRHAAAEVLAGAVEDALLCTHVHPEAIDGALVQAKAVAIAATTEPESLDPARMIETLAASAGRRSCRPSCKVLADGLQHDDEDVFVIGRVGNGIRASQAVAAALWAFLRYGTKPEECVIHAVNFGGDTDTIGAMAGALVGRVARNCLDSGPLVRQHRERCSWAGRDRGAGEGAFPAWRSIARRSNALKRERSGYCRAW